MHPLDETCDLGVRQKFLNIHNSNLDLNFITSPSLITAEEWLAVATGTSWGFLLHPNGMFPPSLWSGAHC